MANRRTIWATGRASVTLATLTNASILLKSLIEADRPGLGQFTIIRTIGHIQVFGETTTRNDVRWGIIAAPSTVTVASIPEPITEPHADWMYQSGCLSPDTTDIPTWYDEHFDLRSMRKLNELERSWFFTMRNGGTQTVSVNVFLRALLKL